MQHPLDGACGYAFKIYMNGFDMSKKITDEVIASSRKDGLAVQEHIRSP